MKTGEKEYNCFWCNKEFISLDRPQYGNIRFCSDKCNKKYSYNKDKESFICDYCGGNYIANVRNNNRSEINLCSKCAIKYRADKKRSNHSIIKGVEGKICKVCGNWHPIDRFSPSSDKWDGRDSSCRDCCNSANKRYKNTIKGRESSFRCSEKRRNKGGYIKRNVIIELYQENINKKGQSLCYYCQNDCGDSWHVDHKTPISRGGSSDKENLAISCPSCNLRKGTKTEKEFTRQY